VLNTKLPANGDENKSLNVCAHKTENVSYLKDQGTCTISLNHNYLLFIRIRYTHMHIIINALVDKNSRAQPFIFISGKILRNELPVIMNNDVSNNSNFILLSNSITI